MFKFNCLVFCVVVVGLRNAYITKADNEGIDEFINLTYECENEFGITIAELDPVMEAGDLSVIDPCFWGCYFKKIGLLNDKGEYDLNAGVATYRKYGLAEMEAVAKQCETVKDATVKDGAAGCDKGFLLANCFLEKTLAYKQK